MLKKIVTGGQTGVDRAALDAAIELNIPYGGWCPKGRIDEQGIIPSTYNQLTEIIEDVNSDPENYNTRTKLNIRDSDGTLIFIPSSPLAKKITDGTLLTIEEVIKLNKPFLIVDLSSSEVEITLEIMNWINENDIKTLNIAGPRESSSIGVYRICFNFLLNFLPKI